MEEPFGKIWSAQWDIVGGLDQQEFKKHRMCEKCLGS